ncbi:hypothetical protein ACFWIQ_34720 [Kitasatospora sp. NPDC127059]|uniref:hypothetical protein n=1 Tax=unclassified Kitasatospora TaxID=2633591 RepID=UPI003648F0EC
MLPRTVRGAVAAAAVVVEEVGKRVVDTAAAVLEKTGVDVAEVERKLGGQFPPSAKTLQTLAEEAVTAGRAGVDLAVGVARGEVEKVFEKVGDQVTKVGVVLAYLEGKLREVEEEPTGAAPGADPYATGYPAEEPVPAPRADDLFGRGWEFEDERVAAEPIVAERVEVDEPVEVDPPVTPVTPVAPVAPVPPPAVAERAVNGTAAKKATAKKATAKKATAKKAVAKKTTAEQAATKKAAAKKTTVAKKSAVRKTAQRKHDAPQPKAAAKRTATKKTTVRKATSTKKPEKPDVRDE